MKVDALAVRLRARTDVEHADLGVRLCQHAWRPVYACYATVAVPTIALALGSFEIATWLPAMVIWFAKPWLDRPILFALSRAAFGQPTTPRDLWHAQWQILWRQFVFTWTIRRLSLWRSLTQPVYTLEEFSITGAHARVRLIRRRAAGSALMVTHAFGFAEFALTIAVLSLAFWFAPTEAEYGLFSVLSGDVSAAIGLAIPIAYGCVVLFLEPFYVAAGFAMYLGRRAELEAWDLEQEFRRAFAA